MVKLFNWPNFITFSVNFFVYHKNVKFHSSVWHQSRIYRCTCRHNFFLIKPLLDGYCYRNWNSRNIYRVNDVINLPYLFSILKIFLFCLCQKTINYVTSTKWNRFLLSAFNVKEKIRDPIWCFHHLFIS